MSLSSLSAQLASLNASSSNVNKAGSSLNTSKRHEDAIGRGIAHSATHGHAITSEGARFKPSVLYADAKEASDVPLTTLRENCVSCLQELSKLTKNHAFVEPEFMQSLGGTSSLKFERGMATAAENKEVDRSITKLLSLLSTVLGESSVRCIQSSLHVIEYLLRRYDIHLRSNTAQQLVLTALAHHEKPFFLRILQLVDLASMPTWSFLRPYAGKDAQSPTRTVIAKRASRDTALLVHCCEMAKTATQVHAQECDLNNLPPLTSPRRGVSMVISFAAAILVEALSIQTKVPANRGSIAESSLRSVFPFVLAACGDNKSSQSQNSLGVSCPDWRSFGHVMANTISEHCALAPNVVEALSSTLVKGALETDNALHDNTDQDERLELAADFCIALMTILSNTTKNIKESNAYLKIIPSSGSAIGNDGVEVELRLGYAMPMSTFRALCKHEQLVKALACIQRDRGISVAPIVASCLSLMTHIITTEKSAGKKAESYKRLLVDLIREKPLVPLWRDSRTNITASFAAELVLAVASAQEAPIQSDIKDLVQAILDELRNINSAGCDAGVAHAVTESLKDGPGRGSVTARKKKISTLLGINYESSSQEAIKSDDRINQDEFESAKFLPPRVALEHPNAEIRLNAVERVMEELTGMDMQDDAGEPLEQALLRRLCVEDDERVAAAAGEALVSALAASASRSNPTKEFLQMSLRAMHKWSISHQQVMPNKLAEKDKKRKKKAKENRQPPEQAVEKKLSDDRLTIFAASLQTASFSIRSFIRLKGEEKILRDRTMPLLLQAIVAHLDFGFETSQLTKKVQEHIVASASKALLQGLRGIPSSGDDGKFQTLVKEALMGNMCRAILRASCSSGARVKNGQTSIRLRRRFMWVMIRTLSAALADEDDKMLLSVVFDASFHLVGTLEEHRTAADSIENEYKLLGEVFQRCAQGYGAQDRRSIPDRIIDLASTESLMTYQKVSHAAICSFCESCRTENGKVVSPILLLVEASSRYGLPDEAVVRLLLLVSDYVSSDDVYEVGEASDAIVPSLMQVGHVSKSVRKQALKVLDRVSETLGSEEKSEGKKVQPVLKGLCEIASGKSDGVGLYSSLLMDGDHALPHLMTKALTLSSEPSRLQETLVRLCFKSTGFQLDGSSREKKKSERSGGLLNNFSRGGSRAAGIVLRTLERTGEEAFPLELRWKFAGEQVFNTLLDVDSIDSQLLMQANVDTEELINSVISMVKGIVVVDASLNEGDPAVSSSLKKILKKGRKRSSSVVDDHGMSFIKPYPSHIAAALERAISPPFTDAYDNNRFSRGLCDRIVDNVFTKAWGDCVYKYLSTKARRSIAVSLLNLRSVSESERAGLAFLSLPMNSQEVSHLLKEASKWPDHHFAVSFCSDWIRSSAAALQDEPGSERTADELFEVLEYLSTNSGTADDAIHSDPTEFTQVSILQALLALLEKSDGSARSRKAKSTDQTKLQKRAKLLVELVGRVPDGDVIQFRQLMSSRAKTISMLLLTSLCTQHPLQVVESLIPALTTTIVSTNPDGELIPSRLVGEAFMNVLPVFCRHATSAGLSFKDIGCGIITTAKEINGRQPRLELYKSLVDTLVYIQGSAEVDSGVGAFICMVVAAEVHDLRSLDMDNELLSFAFDILGFAPVSRQLPALMQLLRYVNSLVSLLKNGSSSLDDQSIVLADRDENAGEEKGVVEVGIEDIVAVTLFGPVRLTKGNVPNTGYGHLERQRIMVLLSSCLSIVVDGLSTDYARRYVSSGSESVTPVCLELWQTMVSLQVKVTNATTSSLEHNSKEGTTVKTQQLESKFWQSTTRVVDEALVSLLSVLPVHVFLVSSTSIIDDEMASDEYRAKAIRLVADRAVQPDTSPEEVTLLLDIVPTLVELLDQSVGSNSAMFMQQSVLVALEHLSRAGLLTYGFINDENKEVFFNALEGVVGTIGKASSGLGLKREGSEVNTSNIQVLCSAVLCASTLVRVLKTRCLPLLPRVVPPMLDSLSKANVFLLSEPDDENMSTIRVLQLSILRALISVTDSLPQFLLPNLSELLSSSGIPSRALRVDDAGDDANLKRALGDLEDVLSKKTPARQLVPALCQSITRCHGEHLAILSLLVLLRKSIQFAPRTELFSVRNWIVKAVTTAYEEYCNGGEDRSLLIPEGNDVFLALVLKLSEAQLRPLYSGLRDWKGLDEPKTRDEIGIARSIAFWSLSSSLSDALRSIFLPCFGSVVSDAVAELDYLSAILCDPKSTKTLHEGKKKRRLSNDNDSVANSPDSLKTLQPILHCLQCALKADAHTGGEWIRSDDGLLFNSLLTPLGKLLQSRVPQDFPVSFSGGEGSSSVSATAFQKVVLGVSTEGTGNVIGCLTALASAAGNEQLWKPLNHVVLEACENESRSEVRKAGVKCLLSLMETLGEEYMVLLPECLPVLSELLEDRDDDIAALAQECVSLGEDLLGESLQDSLR